MAGCLRHADFVPPPPPAPLRAEPSMPAAPAGPLTLEDAVRLALARNPDVRAAAARIAEARARRDAAVATFLPAVSADVSSLYGDAPSAFLFKRIDARSLPAGVDFNDPGTFANLEGGVAMRWNLWNGGRDVLGRWSAEAALDASRLAREVVANALVAEVAATYLDARAAGSLRDVDTASVSAVEAQVHETRVKVDGGGALRADLLSLEVRLAEARERRLRSATAERLALVALRDLLVLPPDATLALAPTARATAPLPPSLAEAVAEAYGSRAEAAVARRAVEAAALELAAARRAFLPRLDLLGRLYADVPVDRALATHDPNYTVALALSVDLFDGGTRAAAVARARAALDAVTESDRKTLLAVAREVETAWLRLEEARARRTVAADAIGAADESLRLVEVQYRGGAAPVTRYLEAETARARARTRDVRARLDVDRATVEVERAIGRLGRAARDAGTVR
jgi:outer membrane protein